MAKSKPEPKAEKLWMAWGELAGFRPALWDWTREDCAKIIYDYHDECGGGRGLIPVLVRIVPVKPKPKRKSKR